MYLRLDAGVALGIVHLICFARHPGHLVSEFIGLDACNWLMRSPLGDLHRSARQGCASKYSLKTVRNLKSSVYPRSERALFRLLENSDHRSGGKWVSDEAVLVYTLI